MVVIIEFVFGLYFWKFEWLKFNLRYLNIKMIYNYNFEFNCNFLKVGFMWIYVGYFVLCVGDFIMILFLWIFINIGIFF